MRLRRLNDQGVARFLQFLDELRDIRDLDIPSELVAGDVWSSELANAPDVELRQFRDRMDLARFLDAVIPSVDDCDATSDVGLWTWLSVYFFDQLCPIVEGRRIPVKSVVRYIPDFGDFRKYYRHLLAGPYRIFRAHRDDPQRARVLLCGPLHTPGEIVEQLASRQELITNPSSVALASDIYFNPVTGTFRRGAAGNGPGSARRFAEVLNQFDLTWDLYSMGADAIAQKLPREFNRFKS